MFSGPGKCPRRRSPSVPRWSPLWSTWTTITWCRPATRHRKFCLCTGCTGLQQWCIALHLFCIHSWFWIPTLVGSRWLYLQIYTILYTILYTMLYTHGHFLLFGLLHCSLSSQMDSTDSTLSPGARWDVPRQHLHGSADGHSGRPQGSQEVCQELPGVEMGGSGWWKWWRMIRMWEVTELMRWTCHNYQ